MIKLIIFDLDGVLADTSEIHFNSLIYSVSTILQISVDEIKSVIRNDGTTTKNKLAILKSKYSLSDSNIRAIDAMKQDLTKNGLKDLVPNEVITHTIKDLKLRKLKLAIGSNSRKENIELILDVLEIKDQFVEILYNEIIVNPKPDPEIFLTVMNRLNVQPQETLILEDSVSGIAAANASGAYVLKINSCDETNLENILNAIQKANYCSANGRDGFQIL